MRRRAKHIVVHLDDGAVLIAHLGMSGRMIGATCLTESPGSHILALMAATLTTLRSRHGQELEEFWFEEAGHSLECLTEAEAGYLRRTPSLVRIGNQMAEASTRHSRGGASTAS